MPGALDTDALIREVEQAKREAEERDNVLVGGGGGGGGRGTNRARNAPAVRGSPAPALDKDNYKRLWEQQNQRGGNQTRPLREQTDEYKASNIGNNESDAAKLQRIKERNNEYNQFLASKAEKQGQRRNGDPKAQGGDGLFATIPGLRYSTSAQKREMQDERNREYNEMIRNKATRGQRNPAPPAAPKQGWGTPTYEEMLDKKRAQESQYRRANDVNFDGDTNAKENQPRTLNEPRRGNQQDGQYFATLPLGANPLDEQARRKEEYKRDLQAQMAEAAYARKAERAQGLLVNNNSLANEQLGTPRYVYTDLTPRRRPDREIDAYHTRILDGLNKLDNISPRANPGLGRRQPSGDRRGLGGLHLGATAGVNSNSQGNRAAGRGGAAGAGGILDLGFESVLDGPRFNSLDPPAALQYQPS